MSKGAQLDLFGDSAPAPPPAPEAAPEAREADVATRVLHLDQNLALLAGAGAGKTYNLVTLCLHLLCGARSRPLPLPPARLCLVTFTDKAAGELRVRLRERVDALARDPKVEEREVRSSLEALGRPFPPPGFWQKVRDELGAASVGTFHSLCVQLLRRAPGGVGVDPSFTLLDEREATRLLRRTAERLVLAALEAEEQPIVELCREQSFSSEGRHRGLVEHLCNVFGRIREEGLEPAAVAVTDPEHALRAFAVGLEVAAQELDDAILALSPAQQRFVLPLSELKQRLAGLTVENFLQPARFPRMRELAQDLKGIKGEAGENLKRVRARMGRDKGSQGLGELYGGWAVAPHERAFRDLLGRLQKAYAEELARLSALDFTELLVRSRDLLRDHPEVRAEAQDRLGALLVDEFQDTNRLQLERVTLLAERRDGAPREVKTSAALEGLPLEPAFLCVVGDRKQSIYEFRGADVSVFSTLASRIEAEGGARAFLQTNWRSSGPLLSFFNQLFAQLMAPRPDGRDFEVAYQPAGDDLTPARPARARGPSVERLVYEPQKGELAERCRWVDADAVARHLRSLLRPDAPPCVEDAGLLRPARGSDVALLFRRFTILEPYRQALTREGIPHRVVRGRGFYGAQEILDLACLLAIVADEQDALSLAAVLRSPLVALSDASLFRVARANPKGRGLDPARLLAGDLPDGPLSLPEDEALRLRRLQRLVPTLRAERDRLGLRALLQIAIEQTEYRVSLAGAPFAEQALANLDKLLELAGQWDAAGTGGCATFARELLTLAETDPTEAQADTLDAGDPRAVQLLTIHQAKGLEWPIVFVPDLCARPRSEPDAVQFDRRLGLALRPPGFDDHGAKRTPRWHQIFEERNRRAAAEYRRTLYVALTRAKDRLVLSGANAAPMQSAWGMINDALLAEPALRLLVQDVPVSALVASEPRPLPPAVADPEAAQRALARVRHPVAPRPASAVWPVTQLQDYFRCPRRFLYLHQVGLSEFPVEFDVDEDPTEASVPGDRRRRGTLAHKLLERTPLAQVGTAALPGTLAGLLAEEGFDARSDEGQEVLRWVAGFWASKFGRRIARAEGARVHRELPFLLRLGPPGGLALHVKGQIDLLFEDDDGSAVVVDCKASKKPPGGLGAYAFQLDCYALAARHFVADGVAIHSGLSFLRERDPSPLLQPASQGALDAFAQRLHAGAGELLALSPRSEWPGRPLERCQTMGCGYQYRCHAEAL